MDRHNILSLLGLAMRGGRLAVGEEPVEAAARARDARVLLLAADAAEGTRRRCEHFAAHGDCLWLRVPFTKEELGRALGRTSVAPGRCDGRGAGRRAAPPSGGTGPGPVPGGVGADGREGPPCRGAKGRTGRPRQERAPGPAPCQRGTRRGKEAVCRQQRGSGAAEGRRRAPAEGGSSSAVPSPKGRAPRAEGTDAVRPQPPGEKGQGLLPQEKGELTDRAAAARGRGMCLKNFPSPRVGAKRGVLIGDREIQSP